VKVAFVISEFGIEYFAVAQNEKFI